MIAALAFAALAQTSGAAESRPASSPGKPVPTPAEVRRTIDRGLAFLLKDQNKDGSFGGARNSAFNSAFANTPETQRSWQVATTALVGVALLEVGSSPETEAACDRALDYVLANRDLKRPADWDVDNNWGNLYGLLACVRAGIHPRYKSTPRGEELRKGAAWFVGRLEHYQSPNGGWGYYADQPDAWRPQWATSFMSAAAVLALVEAKEAGIAVPEKMLAAAVRAVERCRLPNGAFSYDVMSVPSPGGLEYINAVKGSLGRIQVCNLALLRAGAKVKVEDLRRGLEEFFEHHKFLDYVRQKPIPHEGFYLNAAYFYFFGHFYAAGVIERLPPADRARFAPLLEREIVKTVDPDGSMWDFYIAGYTRPYGTAFGIMALARMLALTTG